MDEPLSNLDAKLRVQMRAEIARIQRDLKVTTIYVTHDQSEAMTLGDRVCVMRGGHPPAGRPAAGALRPAREPLRRRLHRLARDEPRRGGARRAKRRRSSRASGRTSSPCRGVAAERPALRLRRAARRARHPAGGHRASRATARRSTSRSTSGRTWVRRSSSTSPSTRRRSRPTSCVRSSATRRSRPPTRRRTTTAARSSPASRAAPRRARANGCARGRHEPPALLRPRDRRLDRRAVRLPGARVRLADSETREFARPERVGPGTIRIPSTWIGE